MKIIQLVEALPVKILLSDNSEEYREEFGENYADNSGEGKGKD